LRLLAQTSQISLATSACKTAPAGLQVSIQHAQCCIARSVHSIPYQSTIVVAKHVVRCKTECSKELGSFYET
uniref:Uncharacterized protein n=1 Tax=Anopheles minimus TaxID=112268 RepID=A0A182WN14_9DIPT